MRKVVVETIEEPENHSPPKAELPQFFHEAPSHKSIPKDDELVDFKAIGKAFGGLSSVQSISMSVPAFLVVLVVLGGIAFLGGKISSGSQGEQAEPTAVPVVLGSTQSSPVQGTPDDIITSVRDEFAKAITLSKKTNQTEADKEEVSRGILHVLDVLTKGIEAYPDIASLLFERAQVEKMVMQSAPKLKAQAEADYAKAVTLAPLSGEYYIGFADYYDVLGNMGKAIENYEKAAQLDPKSIDALYPLAKLYIQDNRKVQSLDLYKKISSLLSPSSSQYTQMQQEMLDLQNQLNPATASPSATPASSPSPTASVSATPAN